MDVKYINPFLDAFSNVFPQLGINEIRKGSVSIKEASVESPGVIIILGIIGDVKGNVIYTTTIDAAKSIAQIMMMGMPVPELNEMAQSAISELTNMLTANACMSFEREGINIDISTPTLMYGKFTAKASSNKVLCIEMFVNNMPFEVNISLDKLL
ncbi:chemotaxis protein CheX [Clostridium sp. YIM B02505]|uniref:Chemotaxis protein CheX n=1 Tax=Clostridium yunnanense TaxID=2800325 RepID=A0ABS1EJ51_9CLOT|nr:chemotaxis protein CheX [Clostridium yunnanense]MBK1809394.1 chemotaxis protein CheX [Clostridium yunnanense]